ncbi:MAG: DUF2589 domain-containing protein [Treponema sp.]|jgi:hypothetical protein|nr:DUF2589 domain-containing protein [Treponema sp.]
MSIGAQFAGLDMENLIGGPLSAAANASVKLAKSTADFINTVGFNPDKSARTMLFKYEKSDADALGNPIRNEMSLQVPLLAIVPIPNLQIDEVNIIFDMEVKECEKAESSLDAGGSFSASVGIGPFRVSISGSVSVHQSNTRSSDNSAKYHVDVRAANHGTPEGLSRVLDILAASAAPTLLASKMVDNDGKEADAAAKDKRAKLQTSYENQQRLGTACKAASEQYESSIKGMKDSALSFLNSQKMEVQTKLNAIADVKEEGETPEKQKEIAEKNKKNDSDRAKYMEVLQGLSNSWNRVISDSRMTVEAVYNNKDGNDITKLFDMKKVKADGSDLDPIASEDIGTIKNYFDNAVQNYKTFKEQEKSLADERANYNALLMKR